MLKLRVMVTGAGSGVGNAIVKSLRSSPLKIEIIVADISPLNVGLYRGDEGLIIPRVEGAGSLDEIIDLLKINQIDALMIGSEFEIEFFARVKEQIEFQTNCFVFVSPLETTEMANDKWLSTEFLREHDLPYPKSWLPKSLQDALEIASNQGFPIILKARKGTSARHVYTVRNSEELKRYFSTVPLPMLQEMIAEPVSELNAEYTCSVFQDSQGEIIGPFTARRTLRGGSSWHIEVQPFEGLYNLLNRIGQVVPSLGSLNVQLMIGPDGPVPFEFNPRFSGTTAVRAHFGFNEPEMAIRSYLLGENLEQPDIRTGVALRYLEEVFIEGCKADDLETHFSEGVVRSWF
jgi:carbamoyl-phosphate synthase large subunit